MKCKRSMASAIIVMLFGLASFGASGVNLSAHGGMFI